MYPSSISRALCSDGMRCIKPLAPSRNETNSSRVNVGADGAILGICADGSHDQGGFAEPPGDSKANARCNIQILAICQLFRIRFPRWAPSDTLPGKDGCSPAAPSYFAALAGQRWRIERNREVNLHHVVLPAEDVTDAARAASLCNRRKAAMRRGVQAPSVAQIEL
jgi:hypothetical protein